MIRAIVSRAWKRSTSALRRKAICHWRPRKQRSPDTNGTTRSSLNGLARNAQDHVPEKELRERSDRNRAAGHEPAEAAGGTLSSSGGPADEKDFHDDGRGRSRGAPDQERARDRPGVSL